MSLSRRLALLLSLTLPLPLQAADCPDLGDTPASLAAVVERVLCANTDTRSAWQRVISQRAQVGVAGADYLPSLSASAGTGISGERIGDGERSEQLSLSVGWLLWDFGARRAGLTQAQRTLDALQQLADLRSQERALAAVFAYFQQLAASDALAAAEANRQAALETARAAERRVGVGNATREDLLQAQTALAQAELGVIQRRGELAIRQGQLATLANYRASQRLLLAPYARQPAAADLPDLDKLTAAALQRRPDRQAQQARLLAAEAELDRLRAQSLPAVSLSLSQGQRSDEFGRRDSGQIALTASLPLFTGFRLSRQRDGARSVLVEQALELERIERLIELDVWQAWQDLETAGARLQATETLLEAASESTRAARARYEAGLGNLLNVLNAQSNLADARLQQAQAIYDLAGARFQLAQASGVLIRDDTTPQELLP